LQQPRRCGFQGATAGSLVGDCACEKEVFATPEAVAAAVKYVTAQLALIDDGTAYAVTRVMPPNSLRCARRSNSTGSAS
jgi:hypothetical protein